MKSGNGSVQCQSPSSLTKADAVPGFDQIMFTSNSTKKKYYIHIRKFLQETLRRGKITYKGVRAI
jgi:hypothetical protein